LNNATISTYAYAGGISAYAQIASSISNCYNTGTVTASSSQISAATYVSAASYAGGILASADDSPAVTISNCYNTGAVTASSVHADAFARAGGICANAYATISNCYNTGAVTTSSVTAYGSNAGGICANASSISNCYNTGVVTAFSVYLSGAGGICANTSTISNCYNTGTVTASRVSDTSVSANIYSSFTAGGICGSATFSTPSTISNCYNTGVVTVSNANASSSVSSALAGGICSYAPTVSNCYNTGSVTVFNVATILAYSSIGGICGSAAFDSISNCYWNIEAKQTLNNIDRSDQDKKGVGSGTDTTTPLTTAQMKDKNSYAVNYTGFNFNSIWGFKSGENEGYPVLRTFCPVSGVTLNKPTTTIILGYTESLIATVINSNDIYPSVTWSSNDPDVAVVDENGTVEVISVGTATITVRAEDHTATCVVTVIYAPITDIHLNKTETSMLIGSTETLTAIVEPDNANPKVIWSSSNETVAIVDGNGIITAKTPGWVEIIATTVDDNIKATCGVSVRADSVAVTGITLDETDITLTAGNKERIVATTTPSNATNQNITWSSNNPSVATVSGGVVTAINAGTATITATTDDGGFTANCIVTVEQQTVTVPIALPNPNFNTLIYDGDNNRVILSCTTLGVEIRYTTDGTEPTGSSTLYQPFMLTATQNPTTIKAKAFRVNWTDSDTATFTYNVKASAPVASPISGAVVLNTGVALSSMTPDATIHYTTDSSEPTLSSPVYSSPIKINTATTIKVLSELWV